MVIEINSFTDSLLDRLHVLHLICLLENEFMFVIATTSNSNLEK
ncbi:hypothetical protein PMEGAS70_51250 [Priestia megaterium]